MGSGMLPPGAYVTYEHEYILIFRKGAKRAFRAKAQREARSRSAFFWEERNAWFSDLWTGLRGAAQRLPDRETRTRSAAFPFALAYRLINMYSVQGDLVLDPFLGTGTTLAAAAVAGRAGVGIERSASLLPAIRRAMAEVPRLGRVVDARLAAHRAFVATRVAAGKPLKHHNDHYDFPVMTRQERSLVLLEPRAVREPAPGTFEVDCAATGPTPRGEGLPGEASR
jgi:signal transduction histidine kinase